MLSSLTTRHALLLAGRRIDVLCESLRARGRDICGCHASWQDDYGFVVGICEVARVDYRRSSSRSRSLDIWWWWRRKVNGDWGGSLGQESARIVVHGTWRLCTWRCKQGGFKHIVQECVMLSGAKCQCCDEVRRASRRRWGDLGQK